MSTEGRITYPSYDKFINANELINKDKLTAELEDYYNKSTLDNNFVKKSIAEIYDDLTIKEVTNNTSLKLKVTPTPISSSSIIADTETLELKANSAVEATTTLNVNRFQNEAWNPYGLADTSALPNITEVKGWYIAAYEVKGTSLCYYLSDKQQYPFNKSTNLTKEIIYNDKNKVIASLEALQDKLTSLKKPSITFYDHREGAQSHFINELVIAGVFVDSITYPYITLNLTASASFDSLDDYTLEADGFTEGNFESDIVNAPFRFGIYVSGSCNLSDKAVTVDTSSSNLGPCNLTFNSFANGYRNTTGGWCSTALGRNHTVLGQYATASGRNSTVLGYASFAGGNQCKAEGETSFVYGMRNKSSGISNTVFGRDNTIDNSNGVHGGHFICGCFNKILEMKSNYHECALIGHGLMTATASIGSVNDGWQFIIGKYNNPDASKIFSVACGTQNAPLNVFTIDKNNYGAFFYGAVTVRGAMTAGSTVTINNGSLILNSANGRIQSPTIYQNAAGSISISGSAPTDLNNKLNTNSDYKNVYLGWNNVSTGYNSFTIGIGNKNFKHIKTFILGASNDASGLKGYRDFVVLGSNMNVAAVQKDPACIIAAGNSSNNTKGTAGVFYKEGGLELIPASDNEEGSYIILKSSTGIRYKITVKDSEDNLGELSVTKA